MIRLLTLLVLVPSALYAQSGFVLERPGQEPEVIYDDQGFSEGYEASASENPEAVKKSPPVQRRYKYSVSKNDELKEKRQKVQEIVRDPYGRSTKKELARRLMELAPIRPALVRFIEEGSKRIPVSDAGKKAKFINETINIRELEIAHQQTLETIYTEKELRALIDFYKTDEGQAVQRKHRRYIEYMIPTIQSMVIRGTLAARHLR